MRSATRVKEATSAAPRWLGRATAALVAVAGLVTVAQVAAAAQLAVTANITVAVLSDITPQHHLEGVAYDGTNGNSAVPIATFTDSDACPTPSTCQASTQYTAVVRWAGVQTQSCPATDCSITLINSSNGTYSIVASHTFKDEFNCQPAPCLNFSVFVTVTDTADAMTGTGDNTVAPNYGIAVKDQPLTGNPLSFNATSGASFSGLIGSFMDANPLAALLDEDGVTPEYSFSVDWGDGTPLDTSGTLAIGACGALGCQVHINGTHIYSNSNTYPVMITVQDGAAIQFTGTSAVAFNGTAATYTVTDDSRISTSVPAGATTGPITVAAPGGPVTSSASFTVTSPPTPPHVMVIVEENQEYGSIIGSSNAPYVNSLATTYASATNWYAVQHNSPNDYLELLSGSNQGLPNGVPFSATTLVDEQHTNGIPWQAYMESMPSNCFTGTTTDGLYDPIHNPFQYFTNYNSTQAGGWCNSANLNTEGVLPYPGSTALVSTLNGANAPDFVWITPNNCDDMHGDTMTGSPCASSTTSQLTKAGDTWLSSNLGPVISSPWFAQNGIIIITWDEGTTALGCCGLTAPGGHIATVVVTSNNKGLGQFTSNGNHYGTLAAIENAYGVPLLLNSANSVNGDLSGAFAKPTGGSISGTVTDTVTTAAISGATVSDGAGGSTTTNSSGVYTLSNVAPATYTVTASDTGYTTQSASSVTVTSGATTTQNFALVPQLQCTSANLLPPTNAAPAGSTVVLNAGAGGCSSPQFEYWIGYPNGTWQVLRTWGGPGFSWVTNPLARGTYKIHVWANQIGSSTTTWEAFGSSTVSLTVCASASLAPPMITQAAGSTVMFTGGSTGCANAQYEYWIGYSNGSWAVLRTWGPAAFSWVTNPAAKGTFTIHVWANNVGDSTTSWEAYGSSTVTLT